MGLLDSILGGALGNSMGQPADSRPAAAGGGGALAALLPIVLSMVAGRQSGAQSGGGLGDILGGMMGGQSGGGGLGGLGSLLEKFQQAGMGDQVKSWVGTGQNLPISPDAIGQVFGGDALSKIAQQAGISESEASAGLSKILPEVVDHLTPDGQLPDFAQLSASVDGLRRKLGA